MDGDSIWLHQDLRDTEQDWFYWYFRVRGQGRRRLRFHFTESPAIGARGPAVSLDEGDSWSWLGADAVEENTFAHDFESSTGEVRFSFGMPYQQARWQRFADGLQARGGIERRRLCTTRKGREAEYALLGCLDGEPRHRVAIACRHHCCEMMASYGLEGLIDWVVRDGAESAAWLREHVQIIAVPFADLDGAEEGDQGKARRPRDHGRDYAGESLYSETAAIRQLLPELAGGSLRVCLDLHCPWMSGGSNETVFLVGSEREPVASEQQLFSQLLESHSTGLIPVSAADFMPYGTSWNTGANHTEGIGFARWSSGLPGVALATCIELPYATAGGAEVNQDTARRFGPDLGEALAAYLRGQDGPS